MSAVKPPQPQTSTVGCSLRGSLLTLAILTLVSFTYLSLKSLHSPLQSSNDSYSSPLASFSHAPQVVKKNDLEDLSSIYHSPELFRLNYAEMERKFKVYIYPDGDPNTYYQTPRKLTGKYASEGYFFQNIRESKFRTDDPNQADLFFIPISCHKMRGKAKDQICRLVQSGVESGARLVLDGRDIVVPGYERGNFVGPTILSHVTTSMDCYKEEIFGPVLLCMQVHKLEDAIALVNRNRYCNGASIFTTSGVAARKFQIEVEAGLVGVNVPVPIPLPFSLFSGSKASFTGDLNFCGKAGVQFYTQIKTIAQRWMDFPSPRMSPPFPPISETETSSRGLSQVQLSASESDVPSRDVSPAMPLTSEMDLPSNYMTLPLASTSEGKNTPNLEVLPSLSPPSDRGLLPSNGLSIMTISTIESNLNNSEMSLFTAQSSENTYIPQTSRWDENIALKSERTENFLSFSGRIHSSIQGMVSTSQGNEGNSGISLYMPTTSFKNEMIQSQRNKALPPALEKMYMPLSVQRNDGMASTSECLYIPVNSHGMYAQNPILSMEEYPGDGVSLNLPTSKEC